MKLSLSGFLFEDDYARQSLSFADFAQLASSAGYRGVELRKTQVNLGTPHETLCEYKKILEDNGLCVTCMTPRGLPIEVQERNDMFRRYLDLARTMNCEQLKMSGDVEWMRQAIEFASGSGVRLAINSHMNSPTETVAKAREFFARIGCDSFGFFYDCMHWAVMEEDYLGAIVEFFPRISNVLVQCVRPALPGEAIAASHGEKTYAKTCIDEDPVQDWPAVIRELKNCGYDGWVTVIENSWPVDEREEVARRTAKYLKDLWGKV